MRDYEPYFTEDGSVGLYSYADNDVYHSKFGALTEAWEKFVLPSQLDTLNINNLKVLDICYGIGYNTKSLMSFLINDIEKKSKIKRKIKLKKIIDKVLNIVTIGTNNQKKAKEELLVYNDTIEDDNNILFSIDCLDINDEIIKLSPLFKTLKTPEEIYDNIVPKIFKRFKLYYKLQEYFINLASRFYPKNKRDINELLDLKFKNMHIEKEYRIHPYVNFILINSLFKHFDESYIDEGLKNNITEKENLVFLDKVSVAYIKFYQFIRHHLLKNTFLSTFLHNIYYATLSLRYKKGNFRLCERMFNINFYINDARRTILSLDKRYDLIFLDAFTYTKAPQLWSAEFIAELYKRISDNGLILTYSTSAQVRNTLLENNFYVGKIYHPKTKKVIGSVASKNKYKIKYPLSNYEIGLCNTKAGIPYHDPNLCFSSKEILEFREYEFRHSELMSSSKYMKIRGMHND